MPKYKLTLAYDGTNYVGWQVQPNGVTIQEMLNRALHQLLGQSINISASGRTDAGVHARGQTAHFSHETPLDTQKFLRSLNAVLPPDIRILSLEEVDDAFHARYSATGKVYHYHMALHQDDPFHRLYRYYYPYPLDLPRISDACHHFVGTHDFTSFTNEAHTGSAAKDPVRTLRRLDMVATDYGLRFEYEADGFLYKMVRNMQGMLIDIGAGKRSPDDIDRLFLQRDRRLAGRVAPAHGLFLMQVFYK